MRCSVCLTSGARAKHGTCTAGSVVRGSLARDYLQALPPLSLSLSHHPCPSPLRAPTPQHASHMHAPRPGSAPRDLTERLPSGARSQFRTQVPDVWATHREDAEGAVLLGCECCPVRQGAPRRHDQADVGCHPDTRREVLQRCYRGATEGLQSVGLAGGRVPIRPPRRDDRVHHHLGGGAASGAEEWIVRLGAVSNDGRRRGAARAPTAAGSSSGRAARPRPQGETTTSPAGRAARGLQGGGCPGPTSPRARTGRSRMRSCRAAARQSSSPVGCGGCGGCGWRGGCGGSIVDRCVAGWLQAMQGHAVASRSARG
eukprot:scaffold4195_cov63-Phaeocystis_antarctica.AAC.6